MNIEKFGIITVVVGEIWIVNESSLFKKFFDLKTVSFAHTMLPAGTTRRTSRYKASDRSLTLLIDL